MRAVVATALSLALSLRVEDMGLWKGWRARSVPHHGLPVLPDAGPGLLLGSIAWGSFLPPVTACSPVQDRPPYTALRVPVTLGDVVTHASEDRELIWLDVSFSFRNCFTSRAPRKVLIVQTDFEDGVRSAQLIASAKYVGAVPLRNRRGTPTWEP